MKSIDLERQLKSMKSYEAELSNVLSALHQAGALQDVIVTGSWAMYFYTYLFNDFDPRVETTDLDLFLPNPKRTKGDNFPSKLTAYSYKRHNDYITGKTLFLSDKGFSVEFLTLPDRNLTPTIEIKGLNVVAEALPKMAPAGWGYIQVEFNGLKVNIVSPISFVLQKLLINKERTPESKKEKDIDAVRYVLNFIKASPKYSKELIESFEAYPKKWKKAIVETAKTYNVELFNN